MSYRNLHTMATDRKSVSQFQTMALDRQDIEKTVEVKQLKRAQTFQPGRRGQEQKSDAFTKKRGTLLDEISEEHLSRSSKQSRFKKLDAMSFQDHVADNVLQNHPGVFKSGASECENITDSHVDLYQYE